MWRFPSGLGTCHGICAAAQVLLHTSCALIVLSAAPSYILDPAAVSIDCLGDLFAQSAPQGLSSAADPVRIDLFLSAIAFSLLVTCFPKSATFALCQWHI